MLPVAQVAREIFGSPGVEAALRLPKRSADNDRLVAAARGMADAAETQKVLFTGKGGDELGPRGPMRKGARAR